MLENCLVTTKGQFVVVVECKSIFLKFKKAFCLFGLLKDNGYDLEEPVFLLSTFSFILIFFGSFIIGWLWIISVCRRCVFGIVCRFV